MALSEREQRLLDEMERGLYESDAALASKLSSAKVSSPQKIVGGSALAVIGISVMVTAVVLQITVLGVVAFLVMLAGLVLASSKSVGSSSTSKPTAPAGQPKNSAPKRNFFEDRWDRRQGQ